MWEFFWRGLSPPLAELCFILSNTLQRRLLCYRKPSVTSGLEQPLTACMVHELLSLRSLPPAQGSVNVQTTVEKRTGAKRLWLVSEQHRMSPAWKGM